VNVASRAREHARRDNFVMIIHFFRHPNDG
jgi:hypothetical protein